MTARNGDRVTMPADVKQPPGFSLKRWSQRKHEAVRAAQEPVSSEASTDVVPPANPTVVPANAGTQRLSTNATGSPPARGRQESPLPPIESLTADSDFTPFLQPKVDETLKRQALRKLFTDPRFNVMDGLDVYIDDYSKSDPIPPDVLARLVQWRQIVDPPPFAGDRPQESVADNAAVAAPESTVPVPPPAAAEITSAEPDPPPEIPAPAVVSAAADDSAAPAPDPDARAPKK